MFLSLPMLDSVGLKVSRAWTDQQEIKLNVIKCPRKKLPAPEYHVRLYPTTEKNSKDLKEWLRAQGCYKSDTPLWEPRSKNLAELTVQKLKRSLNFSFSTKKLDVFWELVLLKLCLVIETLQKLEEVHQRCCCLPKTQGTRSLGYMMLMKKSCKCRTSTINHEI